MGRLTGKVAIVTGGARGMGGSTAEIFAAEGAKVVICDVLDQDGEALAAKIGPGAVFRHLDVTDEANWNAVVADTVRLFGSVDVLVNNAGILIVGTVTDLAKADYERVLSVNLVGTFLGMKAVAPVMFKAGRGSIINIASTEGFQGTNGMGAYASSKWGVRGLTKVAAMEMGLKGVRVNSLHPGPVNTPMGNPGNQTTAELNDAPMFQRQPIQRIGEPGEIAKASLFLASDDSSYITGAELAADGGMTIGTYLEFLPGGPKSA